MPHKKKVWWKTKKCIFIIFVHMQRRWSRKKLWGENLVRTNELGGQKYSECIRRTKTRFSIPEEHIPFQVCSEILPGVSDRYNKNYGNNSYQPAGRTSRENRLASTFFDKEKREKWKIANRTIFPKHVWQPYIGSFLFQRPSGRQMDHRQQ